MRKKIVAGNWKMNTLPAEGVALAQEINKLVLARKPEAGVIIAPPYTHISQVVDAVDTDALCVAAQNCATHESGAYTGEISAKMLSSMGVKAVILGHSERRSYYHETNESLQAKTQQVLANNMRPIFCCGEVLEQREAEKHFDVVKSQIEEVVFKLSEADFAKIIIAYEPVWAIGTGKTASPEQAQEMHQFIRQLVADKFGDKVADQTTILYGGSCKPSNAAELFGKPDVDGGLIGGASLKAADFDAIIRAF